MKKTVYLMLAASALFVAASCEKSAVVENPSGFNVVINVESDPASKLAFNPSDRTFTWQDGDKLGIFLKDTEKSQGTITASVSGGTTTFSGYIPSYTEGTVVYVFSPYIDSFSANAYSEVTVTVPPTQTGSAADFAANFFAKATVKDVVVSGTTLTGSANLAGQNPVLKFTLPESFDVRKIEITGVDADGAATMLAGSMTLKLKKNDKEFVSKPGNANKITIDRGGSIISGDIFVPLCLTGSNKNGDMLDGKYINRTKTFTLAFFKEDGSVANKVVTLSSCIKGGVIKNIGEVKTLHFPKYNPAKLSFIEISRDYSDQGRKLKPMITLSGLPEGSTCYYTLGDTPETAAPTVESDSFDPAVGIDYSTGNFTKKYLKVLVKNANYDDTYYTACVRDWAFETSADSYSDYTSKGSALPYTTNGMNIYSTGETTFTISNSNVDCVKCAFDVTTEYAGNAVTYIYGFTKKSKAKGFAIYYDGTSLANPAVEIKISPNADKYYHVGKCFNIDGVDKDKVIEFRPAGDRMNLFTLAVMEIYEDASLTIGPESISKVNFYSLQ